MIIARPIGVCSPLPIVKDPNGPGIDASSITSGTIDAARLPGQGNTIYTVGDSLAASSVVSVGSNFKARYTESAFNWTDRFLGGPFYYQGNLAAGGKTCRNMIDQQFPTLFALSTLPKYVWMSAGVNDIYTETASAETTYARIVEAIEALLARGIVPIWSTIWHKSYDSVATKKAMQCNDMLRRYAQSTPSGLFWDGAAITCDPTDANGQGRTPLASYYYDSAAHPNNMFSMRIGQYAAQQIGSRINCQNFAIVGNEDITLSVANGNLLSNPAFIGTGAASATGITGVVPTGWKVDWQTRTGSGSAACAIVSITDPATGLQIANGLQLTLSGSAASGDILRVYQSDTENAGLKTNLSAGSVIESEVFFKVESGANIEYVAQRVQTNTDESTHAGLNSQTAVALPTTIPANLLRSYPITVLGSGEADQARFDFRVKFNGAGTGSVITLWKPRFRKVS